MLHNVLHTAIALRGQSWLGIQTVSHLFGLLPSVFRFGIPSVR